MTHWGWYWRVKRQHIAKSLCDYRACIDSFLLFKHEKFCGFTVQEKGKVVIAGTLKDDRLAIVGVQGSYDILIEKQPCHFGGTRCFFRCPIPSCNKRMRKLYRHGMIYACRKCFNLAYRSQGVVPSYRFSLMEKKVTDKLEKLGGNQHRKPKGMHWKTFEKLKSKANDYNWKSERAQFEECYKMYGFYP